MPPEENDAFRGICRTHKLSVVPLVAPTTSLKRLDFIANTAGMPSHPNPIFVMFASFTYTKLKDVDSFVYCVSLTGVTGARTELPENLGNFVNEIRSHIPVPVAVGFGISNPYATCLYTHTHPLSLCVCVCAKVWCVLDVVWDCLPAILN